MSKRQEYGSPSWIRELHSERTKKSYTLNSIVNYFGSHIEVTHMTLCQVQDKVHTVRSEIIRTGDFTQEDSRVLNWLFDLELELMSELYKSSCVCN